MTRAAGAVQPQRARQMLALNLENQQPAEGDPRPRLLSVLVLSHLLPAFGTVLLVSELPFPSKFSPEEQAQQIEIFVINKTTFVFDVLGAFLW